MQVSCTVAQCASLTRAAIVRTPAKDCPMERNKLESAPVAMTIPEAARRLAVSPMTIRRLLDRGELARIRIGRSVRVSASSVAALVQTAKALTERSGGGARHD